MGAFPSLFFPWGWGHKKTLSQLSDSVSLGTFKKVLDHSKNWEKMVKKAPKVNKGEVPSKKQLNPTLLQKGRLNWGVGSPSKTGLDSAPTTPIKEKASPDMAMAEKEGKNIAEATPGKDKSKNAKGQTPEAKSKEKALSNPERQQERATPLEDLQLPSTKQDMADMIDMICHLERTIKGEMGATRKDIQSVLQRVRTTRT